MYRAVQRKGPNVAIQPRMGFLIARPAGFSAACSELTYSDILTPPCYVTKVLLLPKGLGTGLRIKSCG